MIIKKLKDNFLSEIVNRSIYNKLILKIGQINKLKYRYC